MVGKRTEINLGALFPRDFLSAIRAAAIHQNDFVRNSDDGLQDARQIVFFVLCDEAHAQAVHFCAMMLHPRQYLTPRGLPPPIPFSAHLRIRIENSNSGGSLCCPPGTPRHLSATRRAPA